MKRLAEVPDDASPETVRRLFAEILPEYSPRSGGGETGGFTAFICWTFQPRNTRLQRLLPVGGFDYLKTLAISRIFLDNFPHVQASVITQKEEIGQVALFFGADDMGGTTMEENVVRLAGTSHCASEQRLRELIEDAGFRPQKRNTRYEWI